MKRIILDARLFVEDQRWARLGRISRPLGKARVVRIAGFGKRYPRRGQLVSYRAHFGAVARELVAIVVKGEADIDPMHSAELSSGAWRGPGEQGVVRWRE